MLAKSYRLRQRRDFKRAYQRGKSLALPCFVFYWSKNRQAGPRIGFSVSKKLGKAVQRNRIKRRCRAAAQTLLQRFPLGYDYIFVVRSAAAQASYAEIEAQMAKALRLFADRLPPSR